MKQIEIVAASGMLIRTNQHFLGAAAAGNQANACFDEPHVSLRCSLDARAVKREDLRQGAQELGLPLEEHIGNVIGFMRERADALGLRGSL